MVNLTALPEASDWFLLFLVPMAMGGLWWIRTRFSPAFGLIVACMLLVAAISISVISWDHISSNLTLGTIHWVLWAKAISWTAAIVGLLVYMMLLPEADDGER